MEAAVDRLILVGRIVGLHGVSGEVKLESFTEPRLQVFRYRPWRLKRPNGGMREVQGVHGRAQGKGLVARIPGIEDRDAAATLVGTEVWIERAQLPQPKPGEYYWSDLEGLEVVTIEGVALGRISHLLATGSNDVMVVKDEVRERLLPFILDDCVRSVDLQAGRVTVDWDPGF
ncbi:MAG: ribosome maturation factor RimM [Xanthomonadales bacterium]|nr:ribosome maturation factor RimM [Xanthomonadales bacterium]